MALQANEIKEMALDVGKPKGRNKKDGGEVETGCWVSTVGCFGSFISSRSKVDSSTSGPTAPYGNSFLACFGLYVHNTFLWEF